MLGSATGTRVVLLSGQRFPEAARGFTWRLAMRRAAGSPLSRQPQPTLLTASRMRAEAAAYRQLAATAQTAAARNELTALAERFAAFAAELEAADRSKPADQPNDATRLECC